MQSNDQAYKLYLTPKQSRALDILNSSEYSELLYGGAKGGGKSVFGCIYTFLQAQNLIELFKITDEQAYPIPVAFIGRKRSVDFAKTTLETWKKIIPPHLYRLRMQDKEIIIENRVKICFGGLDNEEDISKFNSAEFAMVFIDQAEEIDRTDYAMLKGTLRLRYNDIVPQYKILLTANPAPCYLKEEYILAPKPYQKFIQALPKDNPYLDESYSLNLAEAFKHRPELVRAYVEGSWDDLEGSDTLIQHSWVLKCINGHVRYAQDRRVTACDVARFGNDETVIYNLIDNKISGEKIYGMKDAVYTAGEILSMAHKNNSHLIAIDGDGMGGPVVDMVRSLIKGNQEKIEVMEIRSSVRATQETRYENSRSEMWHYAASLFYEQEISIHDDPILIGQLSSIKYSHTGAGGRLKLEPKAECKKRLERSPDRADTLIYGIWATKSVTQKQYDFKRTDGNLDFLKPRGYGWQEQARLDQEIPYQSRYA